MWDQATSRSLISVIIRFRSNKWHPSENNLKPGGNLCAAIIYANASGAESPDYVTFCWCLLIHHFCKAIWRRIQRWHNIVRFNDGTTSTSGKIYRQGTRRVPDNVERPLAAGTHHAWLVKSFGHDGENSIRSEILKVAYQAIADLLWSLDYSKHNFLRAVRSRKKNFWKKTSIACFKLREQMKHLIKVVNYIPRWEITWKS